MSVSTDKLNAVNETATLLWFMALGESSGWSTGRKQCLSNSCKPLTLRKRIKQVRAIYLSASLRTCGFLRKLVKG